MPHRRRALHGCIGDTVDFSSRSTPAIVAAVTAAGHCIAAVRGIGIITVPSAPTFGAIGSNFCFDPHDGCASALEAVRWRKTAPPLLMPIAAAMPPTLRCTWHRLFYAANAALPALLLRRLGA